MKDRTNKIMKWFMWLYPIAIIYSLVTIPKGSPNFFEILTFYWFQAELDYPLRSWNTPLYQLIPGLDFMLLFSVILARFISMGETYLTELTKIKQFLKKYSD